MNLTKKAALYGVATLAALGLAAGSAMAGEQIVTPSTLNTPASNWFTDNTTGSHPLGSNGINAITSAQADPNVSPANGSLQLSITDSTGYASATEYIATSSTTFTLGDLAGSANTISYDSYTDSSSTAPGNLAPAFHLYIDHYGQQLVWEPSYNGYTTAPGSTVPTNTWTTFSNLASGQWWLRTGGTNYQAAANTGTLAQWLAGTVHLASGETGIDSTKTNIYAYGLASGSGWSGSYLGYVDNVAVKGGSYDVTTDFEPTPEPASWAAFAFMGLGTAALMFKARKRKALGV